MLVHRNPRLLQRAIATLAAADSSFFIHVDRKANIGEFSSVQGKNIFFSEKPIAIYWGEFCLVDATLMLIRQALERSERYDYFVLLSGSDYPLRSGNYINAFVEENRGFEFMNLVRMPAPGYSLSKINKLRYPSDKPVRRFALRALAKVGLAERDFKKTLGALEPYSGSQWWTLSRDACEFIVDYTKSNPHIEVYFQNAFTSDEMFFHTILGNSPFRPRIRRNLVYVNWPGGGNHPAMITDKDVTFFEAQQNVWIEDEWGSGEALFARKFSDDRLDLLDRIDEMIRRKEHQAAKPLPRLNRRSLSR